MPKFTFGTKPLTGKPTFQPRVSTPMPLVTKSGSMDAGARFIPKVAPQPRTAPTLYNPATLPTFNKQGKVVNGTIYDLQNPVLEALNAGIIEGLGRVKTSIAGVGKMVAESKPTIKGVAIPAQPELAKKFDAVVASTESWIQKYQPESMTTFQRLVKDLSSGAISIFSSIGIGVLTGGAGASAALFGLMQAGDKYVEQRKAGVSPERAGGIASAQGFVEAVLEGIGLETFLKLSKGTVWNTLIRAGTEAVQEASQTFGENVLDTVWDKNQALSEGVLRSALIGGLLGLPAAVSVSAYEQSSPRTQAIREVQSTLHISEKTAVRVVDTIAKAAITKVSPLVDETLREAQKSITLPDMEATLGIQKRAPLQTTSGMGALVGQPQTISGGVKPSPKFHIALPATATPQISPAVAISPQEASVPTPTPPTPPQIAPTQEELGKSIISGNGQITNDTIAAVLGDKTSLNWEQDGYALRIAYLGGERYAISKIPPISTLPQAVQETPSPVAESAPPVSKMEITATREATIVPTQVGETTVTDLHSSDFIARMKEQNAESSRIARQMGEQRDKELDDALAHHRITKKRYEELKYGGLTKEQNDRMLASAAEANAKYRSSAEYAKYLASLPFEIPPSTEQPSVVPAEKQPWEMTKEEYDSQTLPNKVAFAIVKGEKVLLSGTDNKIGYLAGLAEERGADLYIGDSAAVSIVDTQPLIMGYTFDEIKAAQQGTKLQHGRPASTMPKNAIQVPTYAQAVELARSEGKIASPVAESAPPVSKMEITAKQPWEMTREEFIREYEALAKKTSAAEKDPGGQVPLTPEELALMDKDWKAFSRRRGYTEEEISDYERFLQLAGKKFDEEYASIGEIYDEHLAGRGAKPAQMEPTVSKMETTAAIGEYPEWIDTAARKVADAAQLKSPAYIRDHRISTDLAKRGILRGSSLTDNPDLVEATKVWQDAYNAEVQRLTTAPSTEQPSVVPAGKPAVKWGKWKKAGDAEYRLVNEMTEMRQWGKSNFQAPTFGKPLQFKNDTHSYYLVRESAVPAGGGFSALPASYRVVEAQSGNAISIEASEAEAVTTARRALDGYGQSTDDRIAELVALHGGVANPSVTNTAPLPSGWTTSGEGVTPSYTSNEQNMATQGTGQTIPADDESISRMTVAFDQIEEHLGEKKSEVKAVEGTFQQAFATFLKQSGIPKGALSWEQALDWYKASRGEKSFAKRVEMVKRAVEKYNLGIEEQQRKPILAQISSIQSKANTSHLGTKSVIAIHNLMEHYRKGKLTEAHREELEETLAWVNNNPDTELPSNVLKQLGELDKEALSTMSIPDLQKLQKTLESLYQKGQAERHQFQLRQALQKGQDIRYIEEHGKSLGSVMRGQPTGLVSYTKKMGENIRLGELFRTTAQRLFKRMGLEKFKSTFDDKHAHFAYVRNHYDTELDTIVREEHLKHADMENLTLYTIKQQRPSQLTDVFGMTPDEIESITLTKGQKRLYDAVIRINKALFPSVQMTMAEQYNKIVAKQENFTHLPIASGEEVSYQETPERLLSSHFHGLTKTTEQGFTIERKPYVKVRPEMDFLLSAKEYIRDAIYLIDCQPVIRRIYEAVGSQDAKGSIGEVGQALLKLWSDVQARQGGVDSAYRIASLDKMVTKATYSIMGFKALTGAVQFTSIVDAIALIGPEAYMRGSVALLSPEWRTFIKNHASDIFSGETREVELAALLSMTGIKKLSMEHIIVMDALVRRANWLGGYYKYCSEHGLDFTTSTINKEGIAYASSVTTQAQGSTQAKELPLAISAGAMDYSTASGKLTIKQNKSLMRVVHHFGTFNLYRYNNIKDTIWTEGFAKGNWKKGLSGIIWLWLVGTIVEAAIRRGYRELREKVFNLEETEQQSFWEDILKGSVEVVPFVGPVISMFNYGNDPLPILQMLRDATAGVKSMVEGKSKETKTRGLATAIRGIGGLTGIPGAAQGAQIIKDLIPTRTKKKVKFTLPY